MKWMFYFLALEARVQHWADQPYTDNDPSYPPSWWEVRRAALRGEL